MAGPGRNKGRNWSACTWRAWALCRDCGDSTQTKMCPALSNKSIPFCMWCFMCAGSLYGAPWNSTWGNERNFTMLSIYWKALYKIPFGRVRIEKKLCRNCKLESRYNSRKILSPFPTSRCEIHSARRHEYWALRLRFSSGLYVFASACIPALLDLALFRSCADTFIPDNPIRVLDHQLRPARIVRWALQTTRTVRPSALDSCFIARITWVLFLYLTLHPFCPYAGQHT